MFNPLDGISTGPVVNQSRISNALEQYSQLKDEWDRLQAMTDMLNAEGAQAFLTVSGSPHSCNLTNATAADILTARATIVGAQLEGLGVPLVAAVNTLP